MSKLLLLKGWLEAHHYKFPRGSLRAVAAEKEKTNLVFMRAQAGGQGKHPGIH